MPAGKQLAQRQRPRLSLSEQQNAQRRTQDGLLSVNQNL
jgi:hypothetical protein